MTAKDHNRLIGIFHLIQGGMQAFSGLLVGVIYGILGIILKSNAHRPQDEFMGTLFIVLAFVVAPIILAFAGVNLTAGYKMFKEKPNSRIWGIVASCLCLPGFPLGTALGIYGLWFFFGEEGKNYHLNQQPPNALNDYSQNFYNHVNKTQDFQKTPEPHSWK